MARGEDVIRVSVTRKLREMFDPRIVGYGDLGWSAFMVVIAVWAVWSEGDVTLAAIIGLFALTVLAGDVNEYHLYRVGYALGVMHERNGVSADPGHPRDLRKLRAKP